MDIHARAQVECEDPDACLVGQARPPQRVEECERLDRLLRVEVVAGLLIDEVETGPDDRHALHAVRGYEPCRTKLAERPLDTVIHRDRRVRRESPRLEDRTRGGRGERRETLAA
jgi:hypothetical protein